MKPATQLQVAPSTAVFMCLAERMSLANCVRLSSGTMHKSYKKGLMGLSEPLRTYFGSNRSFYDSVGLQEQQRDSCLWWSMQEKLVHF